MNKHKKEEKLFMRMLHYLIIVVMVLCLTVPVLATQGSITSSSGMVMFNTESSNNWRPVYTGMSITEGMNIKVNASSSVEVKIENITLRLNRPSIYPMSPFLQNPVNAREILINHLSNTMIESQNDAVTSIAGVRASDGSTDTVDLLGIEENEFGFNPLNDAKTFLKESPADYEGAVITLSAQGAIEGLEVESRGEAYFILGWSYYKLEQYSQAIAAFNNALNQELTSEFKGKTLVFKALTLKNMGQFEAAIAIGQEILDNAQLDEFKEEALTICATGYLMLGNDQQADQFFNQLEEDSIYDVQE
jgi:tetratricopeptide (TPR) repeat protein